MRAVLCICVVFIIPQFALAQLRFIQPTADLGELRGGLVYQHRFEFVNESSDSIAITDIRLGCGCLSPVYDKRAINPGEKSSLLMHVRTLGQRDGPRTWQAHVQYRQGNKEQEATLLIGAKIRNEVTIEPSIIAMTVETTLKQELTITDRRALPLKIANVLASSPAIKVNTQTLANGVTKVTLEVSGAALTRARSEETLNIYTDDPHYRHLQVPITLTKPERANVIASPASVEIVGGGSRLVRLRTTGEQAVRVDKIECDHPAIKCTWAPGPGDDATLKIATQAAEAQTRVRVHVGATVLSIPVLLRKE